MKDIPAFPLHPEHFILDEAGMTLRDYFAAKAMQAYITANYNQLIFEKGKYEEPTHCWTDESLAKESYETADAMMKARGD